MNMRLLSKFLVGDGCWPWVAGRDDEGYGHIRVDSSQQRAHRVVYSWLRGPIPAGLDLDHLCRNPSCVNPWHLEPVTRRQNTLRGNSPPAVHALAQECPAGHPYDEINTYTFRGKRNCRACNRAAVARYKARKRGQS